jgi:hypothetical protein
MQAAFFLLAVIGAVGFLVVWLVMPETRPAKDPDKA